jgi:hypothetical protein
MRAGPVERFVRPTVRPHSDPGRRRFRAADEYLGCRDAARSNEIENLDEIKFAVVEPGGRMSFLKN